MGIKQDRDLMDALCEIDEGLDEYEVDFVENVARQVHDQNQGLTPGQLKFALKLQEKHCD